MASVLLTTSSREDIRNVGQTIADRSGSLEVAHRFLDKIARKMQFYAEHPGAGEARPDLGPGVRMLIVGDYVGFYRVVADGIQILLFTHGARDVPKVFRERFGGSDPFRV